MSDAVASDTSAHGRPPPQANRAGGAKPGARTRRAKATPNADATPALPGELAVPEESAVRGESAAPGDSEGIELVSAYAQVAEQDVESTLRPRRLSEFIAQNRVREQLDLLLQGAQRRRQPPEHILLSGAPGLGKTTLAMIVAAELGAGLRITSGPAIERSGDLAAVLTSLATGDVLFIDEIHRIARPAEELLYSAMEDFRVDVVVGKGPGATAIPLDIEPFTLVGATTRSGLLTGPMRDRFGFVGHLDFYDAADLEVLLHRSARILAVTLTADGAAEIAARSRGTPRIANRLLRRVRDFAEVRGDGVVNATAARAALRVYDVDDIGLDRLDKAVLAALVRSFGGGPVGLSTLAVAVGEQAETVEEVCEPFLVRAGLLARTPRGRVATAAAWRHLGHNPPTGAGHRRAEQFVLGAFVGQADIPGNGGGGHPDLFSQDVSHDLGQDISHDRDVDRG